jgi:hypothetical protein
MMTQFRIAQVNCNNNGVCDADEDCTSCPTDCPSLSGGFSMQQCGDCHFHMGVPQVRDVATVSARLAMVRRVLLARVTAPVSRRRRAAEAEARAPAVPPRPSAAPWLGQLRAVVTRSAPAPRIAQAVLGTARITCIRLPLFRDRQPPFRQSHRQLVQHSGGNRWAAG